ncbi:heme ABC transporter ATP-binding protein [Actinomadura spongiicola]|uniref:Heme ABC transporter ATP-binding protein n=1 Tax=Actinomadura spongiicola TaxID=2303421 RepID=A0A372GFT6_9ACTN|nr:heme ABC transporter ATP-binding protein [Actinomadura spongiicola]RFS84256.1 heme ABC transporter ATP-binding protein [Actinomadura spongiicola]
MIGLRVRRPITPRPVPPGSAAVEIRGLQVERGARTVLDGVDLTVRTGEVLALVGPNGAGKSTLLAAVGGDVAFTGGISVDGAPLATWGHTELAMRRAILLQRQTMSFPFTVAQVVRMGRAPWAGTPLEDDDDAAVAEAMRETDVSEFADRPHPRLSGGEQARVALARVLAQRTGTLLLDEPTAALDLHHQEMVFDVVRERASAGAAVVTVVHDLGLAAAHADRVAVLAEGRLVACGPPGDVLTAEMLSAVYRHDIEVLPHPRTGRPLILPRRAAPG